MTLHLTCAFEIIMLPDKNVKVLFHHFFLQFHFTTLIPPVPCISQILTTLICNLVEIGWVCKSTISKSSNLQWLGFLERVATAPFPLDRYVNRNCLAIGGLIFQQLCTSSLLGNYVLVKKKIVTESLAAKEMIDTLLVLYCFV